MKPITEQEQRILDVLLFEGKIPSAPYDITEEHLIAYMHAYVNVLKKNPFELGTSDYRYSRKLAGLTLVKHNVSLGCPVTQIKSGFVYLIENKAFPEHFKVGMCVDTEERLRSYQTYDPYRSFRVNRYEFVLDRRHYERLILSSYHLSLEEGEWVKKTNAEKIFRDITFVYKKVYAR